MGAQYGVWHFLAKPVDPGLLEKVDATIALYGPDGGNVHSCGSLAMLHRAFHATRESRIDFQPYVSARGNVMMWDGRLDNRRQLIKQVRDTSLLEGSDVAIVMAAYERWGTDCFRRLVGDWALSLWDPRDQVLLLAKDFVGTRHLYYRLTSELVEWCTVLDPLVLLSCSSFELNEEYIVGYLSHLPATHITPYVGINSVPPGTFVELRVGKAAAHTYWTFDPHKRTYYRLDTDYEEQFRFFFAESVRRRLRSDSPVLAELSGGMDSSSIVCMADTLLARGEAETPQVDTISYYDDQEPNWNERPYFTKVEQKRGRTGLHLDVGQCRYDIFEPWAEDDFFTPLPGFDKRGLDIAQRKRAYMEANGHRVLLSGIGGDENLGGVPTPIPELADLLAHGDLLRFANQLRAWSLVKKQPWTHLLLEVILDFVPPRVAHILKPTRVPPWLHPACVKRHQATLPGFERRSRVAGPLPSFQANLNTLAALQRQLACSIPSPVNRYDISYPYLDRELLEFLYSLPRDQLVRPGQRRSLLRRAMVGIVPEEILNRKRKAYVSRRPLANIAAAWPRLQQVPMRMISGSLGLVDPHQLLEAIQKARHGQIDYLVPLLATLKLELWLEGLARRGVLCAPVPSIDVGQSVPISKQPQKGVPYLGKHLNSAESSQTGRR